MLRLVPRSLVQTLRTIQYSYRTVLIIHDCKKTKQGICLDLTLSRPLNIWTGAVVPRGEGGEDRES